MAEEENRVLEPVESTLLSPQTEKLDTAIGEMKAEQETITGALTGVTAPEVTYTAPDTTLLKEEAMIDPGATYITPEATVSGQLEKLLTTESPYMQMAEKRAEEQAAEYGLLGSSMAVGAARGAAIREARPIAEADARTFAQAQLQEQQTYNEISRMKAESDLSAAAREHVMNIDIESRKAQGTVDLILEQAKAAGNARLETAMTGIKAQWDVETRAALADVEAQLKQMDISAREREYASTTSSTIMASAYGTVNDLMNNADFMAAYADDPDGLTTVFNNFINLAKNQVQFIGATANLATEYNDPTTGYINLIGSWT